MKPTRDMPSLAPSANPTPWYVEAFGEDYLQRYVHRDEAGARREAEALLNLVKLRPLARVVDACCGAGRHLKSLQARGVKAAGFDLSLPLLAEARRQGVRDVVRADVRRWPWRAGSVDLVYAMFTSWGYFDTDKENALPVREAARILRPGGFLLLDVIDHDWLKARFVSESRRRVPGGVLHEVRQLARGRVTKKVEFATGGGILRRFESVRLYSRDEWGRFFREAGLKVEWPQLQALGEGRLIALGRKP
ncbi:MAG: class I SAM-dependent methyltransferase [Planctomycetota bacterium]